jgi:hypothetical protein
MVLLVWFMYKAQHRYNVSLSRTCYVLDCMNFFAECVFCSRLVFVGDVRLMAGGVACKCRHYQNASTVQHEFAQGLVLIAAFYSIALRSAMLQLLREALAPMDRHSIVLAFGLDFGVVL